MAAPSGADDDATATPPNVRIISLKDLSGQELRQLRVRTENDMNVLTSSIDKLQTILAEFERASKAVKQREKMPQGGQVLAPIADGVFLDAQIVEQGTLLVDIGTGFLVEFSYDKANDYYQRRIGKLSEQISNVQQVGRDKIKLREAVISHMNALVDGADGKASA